MKYTLTILITCLLLTSCGKPTERYSLEICTSGQSHVVYKIDTETGKVWKWNEGRVPSPSKPNLDYVVGGWIEIPDDDYETAKRKAIETWVK
jgi:hypothetical protein